MNETMSDHLVLPLKSFPTFTPRTSLYTAVVWPIGRVNIGMGVQKILHCIKPLIQTGFDKTNLCLKGLRSTARIRALETTDLRICNSINTHPIYWRRRR
jgi:hypothetical protein